MSIVQIYGTTLGAIIMVLIAYRVVQFIIGFIRHMLEDFFK